MPIFMDLHRASDFKVPPTLEDITHLHVADLKVQQRLGVNIFQYWINEQAGLVFCLMEGPDKQSCLAVHRDSHGNLPCNIIELQGSDYMTFMGDEFKPNEFDLVTRPDGSLDTGYRIILVADFISITGDDTFSNNIHSIIEKKGGRYVNKPGFREMIVFTSSNTAIECALNILKAATSLGSDTNEIRIGISAGAPVTADRQDIFAEAIQLANRLCDLARNKQIIVSSLTRELTREPELRNYKDQKTIKLLMPEEEQFLNLLVEKVTPALSDESLDIESLGKKIGVSRSGLYRKITELTGYSANHLIRELRMQKALKLIRNKYGNIAQVSLEVGINNPSFFAKSFQDRFGIPPSAALKLYS